MERHSEKNERRGGLHLPKRGLFVPVQFFGYVADVALRDFAEFVEASEDDVLLNGGAEIKEIHHLIEP